jgi:serine/threonine protein kinase
MAEEQLALKTFDLDDLKVGRHLGSGGFASVYSITFSNPDRTFLDPASNKCNHDDEMIFDVPPPTSLTWQASERTVGTLDSSNTVNSLMQETAEEEPVVVTQQPKLVLKTLHRRTLEDPEKTKHAAADLRTEVKILWQLAPHPNIIRLHGVSTDFWTSPKSAFIVLEKLEETLDKAILRWRHEKSTCLLPSFLKSFNQERPVEQAKRIQKVIGIASALEFLHQQDIIFRDLKPSNIGFDHKGAVKLFDFAIATKLEENRKLLSRVGTLRYMAPEVAMRKPYDRTADSYSFGMVLWEVCSLEEPYRKARNSWDLSLSVMQSDKHPKLNANYVASIDVQQLLKHCWEVEPKERPSFTEIKAQMQLHVDRVAVVSAPSSSKVAPKDGSKKN